MIGLAVNSGRKMANAFRDRSSDETNVMADQIALGRVCTCDVAQRDVGRWRGGHLYACWFDAAAETPLKRLTKVGRDKLLLGCLQEATEQLLDSWLDESICCDI